MAGGLVIAVLAVWTLSGLIQTSTKAADPIDITKLGLAIAGGVGGAVALVVAYRRQRDIEQGRFVERFGAAAAQLGASQVAVRIAGVYAMAGVADESTGLHRQQCIDVLCGYLRLPYSPELGENHQTKSILKRTSADTNEPEVEEHFEYLQNDKQVRSAIVRVIADHLRSDEHNWSANDFDFWKAHLVDADFSNSKFAGNVRFGYSTFVGYANFTAAIFTSPAALIHARFLGNASFEDASFGDVVAFDDSNFDGYTTFERARFRGRTTFFEVKFSSHAIFDNSSFSEDVSFEGAKFSEVIRFVKSRFSRRAIFGEALFSASVFHKSANFSHAAFLGATFFNKVTFSGQTNFQCAEFAAPTTFENVDFGSETIAFDEPQRWGPPPPQFDWDQDLSLKPENVTPVRWPPAQAPDPTT